MTVETGADNRKLADLAPAARLGRVADQAFFIVGCGRSGTTLLQSMLISHPEVVIPPETKFYGAFVERAWLYGDLKDEDRFRKAVRAVWDDQRRRGVETDRDTLEALAMAGERTWDGLLLALLAAYALKQGAERVGEKSPVHTHHVGALARGFPKATFVHIVRDPRAVMLSRITAGFGTRLIGPNIERWRKAWDMHREFGPSGSRALGPARYAVVRYEDLVTSPRETLERVCRLIGLDLRPEMLEPHKREKKGFAERSSAWMSNTLKPISTSSLEKWKKGLRPEHIALTEWALADGMREFGYEPGGARTALPALRLGASNLAGWLERKKDLAGRAVRKAMRGGKPAASMGEGE